MEPKLIKEEHLDNGITLRLYDASKGMIGDRWLVALEVNAIVPVNDKLLSEETVSPEELTKIRQVLGEEVVFEQKRERYFIDEQEKQTVFDQILESWLSSSQAYISHQEFPIRFVKKCFKERLAQQRMNR